MLIDCELSSRLSLHKTEFFSENTHYFPQNFFLRNSRYGCTCVCMHNGGLGSALHVFPQELHTLCLPLLLISTVILIDQEEQEIFCRW